MSSPYRTCQSCGMPLRRDAQGGGTNADGSRSDRYCSHCFVGGAFTLPHISAAEMQERATGKLREMGFPGFVARFLTRNIPRLERWKSECVR